MSTKISGGVRRPRMYFLVAIIAVAVALPLAVASGEMQMGGVFDECYGACSADILIANLPD